MILVIGPRLARVDATSPVPGRSERSEFSGRRTDAGNRRNAVAYNEDLGSATTPLSRPEWFPKFSSVAMVTACCRRPRSPADDAGRRRRPVPGPSTRRSPPPCAVPLVLTTGVRVNLLKSPLRRTTAVLAGAFIGLAGAVAAAAPASAHHPLVSAESSCVNEDGSWTVTWKVANSEDDITAEAKIAAQPKDESTLTGVGEDGTATLPKSGEGALTVEQALTAEANWAKLVVRAKWVRGEKEIKQSAD